MTYQTITLDIENHVALITLNRQEAMNTFTGDMGREWSDAYLECDNNDDVRVIVVTGAGKAFCAGADMSEGAATFDKKQDMSFSTNPIYPAYKLKKPVIAAMNGHAVGVGLSFALQCDFRIACEDASYGLLQVRRGVLADACTHWLLPRLLGMEKAMEVMLFGKKMTGVELAEKGLALKSLPAEQVLPAAMEMATELATDSSPLVAGLAKQLMWRSLHMSIDDMETLETKVLHHTMGTGDALEGGAAYFEKRQAQWQTSIPKDWPNDLLEE